MADIKSLVNEVRTLIRKHSQKSGDDESKVYKDLMKGLTQVSFRTASSIAERVASRAVRASALSSLPASKFTDKLWNELHDLEAHLDSAAHEYDVAGSYRGGPGERDAKKVMQAIKDTQKQIDQLTRSGGAFDKLFKVEQDFAKKYGGPEAYAEAQRDKMYPR